MEKFINKKTLLSFILLSLYSIKLLIVSASIADALVMLVLAAMHSVNFFLIDRKEFSLSQKTEKDIDELKRQLSGLMVKSAAKAQTMPIGTKF